MSRIGKKAVAIPAGVTANIADGTVSTSSRTVRAAARPDPLPDPPPRPLEPGLRAEVASAT